MLRFTETRQPDELSSAASDLARIRYDLRIVRPHFAVLSETAAERGWGWYVIDLTASGGLLVEVPSPLDEPGTFAAGLSLFQSMSGRALAVGGASRDVRSHQSAGVLNQRQSLLAAFHRMVGPLETLQIRRQGGELPPTATLAVRHSAGLQRRRPGSMLWIESGLPDSLPLPTLQQLVPEFQVQWKRRPSRNTLRDQSRRGFVELVLSPQDAQRFQSGDAQAAVSGGGEPLLTRQGYLHQWLLADKEQIATQNSQAYQPASLEEMLFLDREIITPLVRLAASRGELASYRRTDWEQLKAIRKASRALQYDLVPFRDQGSGDDLLLLTEMAPKQRHWGTFLFRCGLAHPYAVEIPRPLHERYAYEFGIALFERPVASVLLAAGAHPGANSDGSADVTRLANKVSALNLVRQVLLREQPTRAMVISQARAIRAPVGPDVVLAIDDGLPRLSALPPLIQRMVERMQEDGLTVEPVDGSFETAGYELGILLQSSATKHSQNKQVISLWLSPSVRRKFREPERQTLLQAQFDAVEIPTVDAELGAYLRDLRAGPAREPLDESFRMAVQSYLANCDVIRLWNLRQRWPSWQLLRLIDVASGQAFLLAAPDVSQIPVVFNLSGTVDGERQIVIERLDVEAVREFVHSRRIARDQEPTVNLRKTILIGLLLVLIGAAVRPTLQRQWQDFQEQRRLERFEVGAARTAAYPLEPNAWLEFNIPQQARALRVLTNAAVPDFQNRPKTQKDPRLGWRYAIRYELLNQNGDALDGAQYHFRAVVIERPNAETGGVQSASWFGDSDRLPTMTRTAQLPFDSATEKPSRLRIRLAARDPEVQEVVVRAYIQYERSDYQQPFVWSRLSPEARERLCRPLVYSSSLLTAREKQNLARWDWTALPPNGLEGRDYRTRWFYQSADVSKPREEEVVTPEGPHCGPDHFLVLPLPAEAGTARIVCQRLDQGTEAQMPTAPDSANQDPADVTLDLREHFPVRVVFEAYPPDARPSQLHRSLLEQSRQTVEIPTAGGWLEVRSFRPDCLPGILDCGERSNG